jgi:ribosomal protein L11 methyltransferase
VVANILAPVILGLLPDVRGVLGSGGHFICSGILQNQQDEVVAKARSLGFELVEALEREEWVALVFK